MSYPVRESDVEASAEINELEVEDVESALERVQKTVVDDLSDFFQYTFHRSADTVPCIVIALHPHEHFIFAVKSDYLEEVADRADLSEIESQAVQDAYYQYAENRSENGFGVDRETVSKNRNNLMVVEKPDGWGLARLVTLWEFGELFGYDLSAAEALDYWAVERQDWTPRNWSGSRGVSAEAVRKNCRQAREKVGETADD